MGIHVVLRILRSMAVRRHEFLLLAARFPVLNARCSLPADRDRPTPRSAKTTWCTKEKLNVPKATERAQWLQLALITTLACSFQAVDLFLMFWCAAFCLRRSRRFVEITHLVPVKRGLVT